jgi:hypothetical protein
MVPAGVGLAQLAVPPLLLPELLELLPLLEPLPLELELELELLPPEELEEADGVAVREEPQAASSRQKQPARPARKFVWFTLNLLSTKAPVGAL